MTIEAMKLMADALGKARSRIIEAGGSGWKMEAQRCTNAIEAGRQAIAELEKQEPVAYDIRCDNCGGDGYDPKDNNYFCSSCEGAGFLEKLFYTAPQPKRELPNLTVDELIDLEQKHRSHESLSRAIEAKRKEKANEH